jgi:hypothetical protein
MSSLSTTVDTVDLRRLASPVDPCASVYLDLSPVGATADRDEELRARWRTLADALLDEGADSSTVDVLWHHVRRAELAQTQWSVFASNGTIRFAQALRGLTRVDRAHFSAPVDLVPLLAWLQRHPPYVVVVTDRLGADLTATPRGAAEGAGVSVDGPDDEIERNAPGGWAQARYQRRAEDSWRHNAAAVARQATRALREVDGELLLVAGDVRAVQLLRDHLPSGVRRRVVLREIPGGRGPDGSHAGRQAAVAAAVAEYANQRTEETLEQFEAGTATGTATEGAVSTLAALADGRVRTLLVADDPGDDRVAWFGPDTLASHTSIQQPGASSWVSAGRLVDVAVRAALLTDAEVQVLGPSQAGLVGERIGALCRFAAHSPRT